MSISFKCECGNFIEVDDSFAGKDVQCPRCYTVNTAPDRNGIPVAKPVAGGGRWSGSADQNRPRYSSEDTTAQPSRSLEGKVFNGGVVGGLIAMLIAVVWFVGGLMADIIFFYPPILFIIGLVGFIKGLVSNEE